MKFLAFDTSTDVMSIALTDGASVWQHSGPGGAKSSATLIPAILDLLAQAQLTLGALDAIVFGRGPGSFTGLRTACAVAQGLALGANHGAGVAVLPLDTLMAVAEEARYQRAQAGGAPVLEVTALLDARMDEMYVQRFQFSDGPDGSVCTAQGECTLIRPENLRPEQASGLLAGNVFGVYADRLRPELLSAGRIALALPTATAMLRLAPQLAASGHCVDAGQALPLYVRDKVAFTTEERALAKAQNIKDAEDAIRAQALLAGPN